MAEHDLSVKHFLELFGGGKAFHYQTSKHPEEYFKGTLSGIFVGVGYRFTGSK